ncbi:hypothetical protein E1B28_004044 [Marasmius oreades]|uniref:AB hydrolase-1 domain-containing protein n=1 Tax=Marasmius oreades TaxID=181124 RepID=A0A9P8AC94_9AGAR|nr:uncharacterized protein E1B28_004044 [Marasmius oreades]KAG7096627.1 hypothetical protein E1B28_004044 [Marasmius oreades]
MLSSTVFIYLQLIVTLSLTLGRKAPGTLHSRNSFYVGGEYSNTEIAFGQIYVEHLVPADVTRPLPLMFICGRGQTGINLLNTPDGRAGWADYFLSQGYEVYLIDQPSRGRSPWQKSVDGPQTTLNTTYIESHFTATARYHLYPQADLHTQWPGSGVAGDPIFDAYYFSTVPSLSSDLETSQKMRHAGVALLERIGQPVILMTHSQSGAFGWLLRDARPSFVRAIIALEPVGPPFINAVFPPFASLRPYGLTELPIQFSPPLMSPKDLSPQLVNSIPNVACYEQISPARQLVNLADVPILVVTAEASYHVLYDNCTVNFLKQAGVKVDHVELGNLGFHGNGHMMFLEKNSDEIVDQVVHGWILEKGLGRKIQSLPYFRYGFTIMPTRLVMLLKATASFLSHQAS